MGFVRARTDLQKEIRYSQIIEATQKIYDTTAYDDISLALIAREAKFTRSNLYKYYSSKEEIFVDVVLIECENARKDIENAFEDREYSVDEFSEIWSEVIGNNRKMLDLRVLDFVVLEKKLSLDQLINFKKEIKREYERVIEVVSKCLPKLSSSQLIDFIYMQFSLSVGFHMVDNVNKDQKKASEVSGFSEWKKTMKELLQYSIKAHLNSVINS